MWGDIELEPEVRDWLEALTVEEFGRASFYLDLLEERGVELGFPYTSQLHGKLRELRFYLDRTPTRLAYYVAADRRIILLTVFRKTTSHDRAEVARARRAMEKCVAAGHTAEED